MRGKHANAAAPHRLECLLDHACPPGRLHGVVDTLTGKLPDGGHRVGLRRVYRMRGAQTARKRKLVRRYIDRDYQLAFVEHRRHQRAHSYASQAEYGDAAALGRFQVIGDDPSARWHRTAKKYGHVEGDTFW